MTINDYKSQRLFIDGALASGVMLPVSEEQFNYLVRVLRLREGDRVLVFNGRDGEWEAKLAGVAKRSCQLELIRQTRVQTVGPDVRYLFAPLKRARLDYMVQKAVELGVGRLSPVITRRTVAERVNLDRMLANAIEAAEQCGILNVPVIDPPTRLDAVLSNWDPSRQLIFCDEAADVRDPVEALAHLRGSQVAVLLGPEGGFDPDERSLLSRQSYTTAISLGPRIMRADTAAVAALALVNAVIGDWR